MNLRSQNLACCTFYAKKNSYAGCPGLSPAVLPQFTRKMRVTTRNREKFTKTPYFGGSRSSMFTFLKSSSPVLVAISSMFVTICNHFHVRRANNGRITLLRGRGCPSFSLSFVGTPFNQWHEVLSLSYHQCKPP